MLRQCEGEQREGEIGATSCTGKSLSAPATGALVSFPDWSVYDSTHSHMTCSVLVEGSSPPASKGGPWPCGRRGKAGEPPSVCLEM